MSDSKLFLKIFFLIFIFVFHVPTESRRFRFYVHDKNLVFEFVECVKYELYHCVNN